MNVNAIKFRKKPVVIEAYQWKESDALNLRGNGWPQWLIDATRSNEGEDQIVSQSFDGYATIKTLEGEMRADIGDWIIRGVKGELYPCKPDIFAATYESADIDLNAADFSDALMWLKEGKRVQRAGWNAGGQWVRMWSQPYAAHTWKDDDFCYAVEPGLVLKNAQNQLVQWVPSMGDLMATDWRVVS